ncbi:MAG TPA: pilin [Candidatus Saccharimonadales bacterium]
MKRLLTFVTALLLLTGATVFITPVAASAQTKAQAKECFKKYDGKRYEEDSDPLAKFRDTACAHPRKGNCKAETVAARGLILEIKCTQAPETNGKSSGGGGGGSSADGDVYVDDAITDPTCDDNGCDLIDNYVNPFIRLLSVLVGIAAVIGIIVGAIQVSTSAGDPQKAAAGKDHIRNALIALVAYVMLFVFLNWIIPGGIV